MQAMQGNPEKTQRNTGERRRKLGNTGNEGEHRGMQGVQGNTGEQKRTQSISGDGTRFPVIFLYLLYFCLDDTRFSRDFSRFLEISLDFTRFYQIPLDFTRFHWI